MAAHPVARRCLLEEPLVGRLGHKSYGLYVGCGRPGLKGVLVLDGIIWRRGGEGGQVVGSTTAIGAGAGPLVRILVIPAEVSALLLAQVQGKVVIGGVGIVEGAFRATALFVRCAGARGGGRGGELAGGGDGRRVVRRGWRERKVVSRTR